MYARQAKGKLHLMSALNILMGFEVFVFVPMADHN
jgi:hypothetical protein